MKVHALLPTGWRAALRAVLPGPSATAPMRPIGAGLDCWAVLLGDDLVLRVPRNDVAAASIERDGRLLAELAPLMPVPIPQRLFTASNPFGPGLIGAYRHVAGEALDEEEWHRQELLTVNSAATIARVIDAVATFPVERAIELGVTPSGDRADFAADVDRLRADVAPLLDRRLADTLLGRWRDFVDDENNFASAPAFLHGDLSLDHLLVSGRQVVGLIDFGDAAIGDPDSELGYLWAEAGPSFVAEVQAARGRTLTKTLAAKLAFFQLADEVGDVMWAIDHHDDELLGRAVAWVTATLGGRR